MGKFEGVILNVDGKQIVSTEITYEDLVWLYESYIKRNGKVPLIKECLAKNNLPQGRIIKRILEKNGITYKDFLLQFGKFQKVRATEPKYYDIYLDKFLEICQSLGRSLREDEFINNQYGLPGHLWFIKYCPDKSVNSYCDFLEYCGLSQNKHIWTKEEVIDVLMNYEKELKRPLIQDDITIDKIGFSIIVIKRLFGSFSQAKDEIGLMETLPNQPLPFEHYQSKLKEVLDDYISKTHNPYITWQIIESGKYGSQKVDHKSMCRSFRDADVDLNNYIYSFGLQFNPSFGNVYIFPDGEKTESNYEYDISKYLREQGLNFKDNYSRSVRYNDFANTNNKMTCDYCVHTIVGDVYIEVAGMIDGLNDIDNWRTHIYSNKISNAYRDKMILKEKIFIDNNLNYIFIFANEMKDGSYKKKLSKILQLPI